MNRINNGDLVCYDEGGDRFWIGYLKNAPFSKEWKRLIYHFVWDDTVNAERRLFILVNINSPHLHLIEKGYFT